MFDKYLKSTIISLFALLVLSLQLSAAPAPSNYPANTIIDDFNSLATWNSNDNDLGLTIGSTWATWVADNGGEINFDAVGAELHQDICVQAIDNNFLKLTVYHIGGPVSGGDFDITIEDFSSSTHTVYLTSYLSGGTVQGTPKDIYIPFADFAGGGVDINDIYQLRIDNLSIADIRLGEIALTPTAISGPANNFLIDDFNSSNDLLITQVNDIGHSTAVSSIGWTPQNGGEAVLLNPGGDLGEEMGFMDITGYNYLVFKAYHTGGGVVGGDFFIRLYNANPTVEFRFTNFYPAGTMRDTPKYYEIPLSAFASAGADLTQADIWRFADNNEEIRFTEIYLNNTGIAGLTGGGADVLTLVDDFSDANQYDVSHLNDWGEDTSGAGFDLESAGDLAGQLHLYWTSAGASWHTELQQADSPKDLSSYDAIRFKIRLKNAGPLPVVELWAHTGTGDQIGFLSDYISSLGTIFTEVTVPLADWTAVGADITQVDAFQLRFSDSTGDLYIDDVYMVEFGAAAGVDLLDMIDDFSSPVQYAAQSNDWHQQTFAIDPFDIENVTDVPGELHLVWSGGSDPRWITYFQDGAPPYRDLSGYDALRIRIRNNGGATAHQLNFRFRDDTGNYYRYLSNYVSGGILMSTFTDVDIPLSDMTAAGINTSAMEYLIIEFVTSDGDIFMDHIAMVTYGAGGEVTTLLDDFSDINQYDSSRLNDWGESTDGNGLTSDNASDVPGQLHLAWTVSGGSWYTELQSADAANDISSYDAIRFSIRRESGSGMYNIELWAHTGSGDQIGFLSDYISTLTTAFTEVTIPLSDWTAVGANLTTADAFQLRFNDISGSIFMDNFEMITYTGAVNQLIIDDFNLNAQWIAGNNDISESVTYTGMQWHSSNDGCVQFTGGGDSFQQYLNRDISAYDHWAFTVWDFEGGQGWNVLLRPSGDGSSSGLWLTNYLPGGTTGSPVEIQVPFADVGRPLSWFQNFTYLGFESPSGPLVIDNVRLIGPGGGGTVVNIDNLDLQTQWESQINDLGQTISSSSATWDPANSGCIRVTDHVYQYVNMDISSYDSVKFTVWDNDGGAGYDCTLKFAGDGAAASPTPLTTFLPSGTTSVPTEVTVPLSYFSGEGALWYQNFEYFGFQSMSGPIYFDDFKLYASGSVNIDPVISYNAPSHLQWGDGNFVINVTATDADGTVTEVEYQIDGGSWVNIPHKVDDDYQVDWDSTMVADGNHTMTVRVIDNDGASDTATITVRVDNTTPSVTITSPAVLSFVSGTSVPISVNMSDSGSGISLKHYRIDSGIYVALGGTGPYTASWNSTLVSDGSHSITGRCMDAVGNYGYHTINITVDNTPPDVSITAPLTNQAVSGVISIDALMSDVTTSVATAHYRIDGGAWQVFGGAQPNFSSVMDTLAYADGVHSLMVEGIDAEGNASNLTISFIVDNAAPTISIGNDETNNMMFLRDTTVSDPGSGISTFSWSQQSGPGIITFGSSTAEDTTISATMDGIYTIRLTVEDMAGNISFAEFDLVWDTTPPTASNPAGVNVQCPGDVPAPDPLVVNDEADTYTLNPQVVHSGDVSDSGSCPETITRTYTVSDDVGNSMNVQQVIVIDDTTPPTATPPADVNVECGGAIPLAMPTVITDEADNCTASPTVVHLSDVSDSGSCPETITRTYRITDDCGNFTDVSHNIIIEDTTAPTASNPPDINVDNAGAVPSPDPTVVTDEADICTAVPLVSHNSDVSDGFSWPETISRYYDITDDCGNTATVTQLIIIDDLTPPVVDAGMDVTTNAVYTQNAAVDASTSGVSNYSWSKLAGPGNITFGTPDAEDTTISADTDGTYTIRLTVTDNSANTDFNDMVLTWDATGPVINLSGADPQAIEAGSPYTELGASAIDARDGDVSGDIIINSASVNTAIVGSYTVTYDVVDSLGNSAIQVTRTVDVVDTTAPVITLTGSDPQTIEVGSGYTELGAMALDNYDGDISVSIVINSAAVNTGIVGSYIVTYDVTDSEGNTAVQVNRTVDVVDTTAPVITLSGADPQTIEVSSGYSELGATALDNYDGDVSGSIMIDAVAVNTGIVGSYMVTYDVMDSNGNAAVQVTRTVDVVDTTAPVITLTGSDPQTIEVGSPYVELGATALDNYDGDISPSIVINTAAVNTAVVGSYIVTYDVTDSQGNSATQVTRTVDVVDTTAPVITLTGADPQTIEVGSPYVEQGTTALDNYDGDISGSIIIDSAAVNTGVIGSYMVTYDVTDSQGNSAIQVTRTVDVVDTTAPVITLTGSDPQTIEVGSGYTELGATALDNYDGDISGSIVINSAAVNTAIVGSYSVTYDVIDSNANTAVQVNRTVDVVDTTAPVITLTGTEPQTVEVGSPYVEQGATALDNYDGDITPSIIIDSIAVNTAVVGSYMVTYDVIDSEGNNAVQVTRTVDVVDTTAPVITLTGSDPQTIEVGSGYTELGATALDNYDGDISGSIVINSASVNTGVVGSYIVTYDVTDSEGNNAVQVTRTVDVVDTTAPVITLIGPDPQTIEVGSPYVEQGATALDNYDGDITPSIMINSAAVNTAVVGSYIVTFDVTDGQGNAAVQVTRTVDVVDTTAPVITLTGADPQTIEVGSGYTEIGATALDNYDGDVTPSIIINSAAVNTGVVGSYIVTYDVTDSEGNAAVQVTRTVDVVDTTAPVITLTGSDPQTIEVGSPYIEQGATALDNYDGDITPSIVINSAAVNTGVVGSYIVTYDVTDSEGNAAVQVTRTVDVVDTIPPGLAGMNPPDDATNVSTNIGLMLSFDEVVFPGSGELIISNLTDGTEHERINTTNTMGGMNYALNNLLSFEPGKDYAVIVPVTCYTDIAGNPFSAVLTANVWNFTTEVPPDTTPPVITLIGSDPQTIEVGSPYLEQGAAAMDDRDGDITAGIIMDLSAVNTNALGSYIVTYNVSDSNGNTAVQVTRTVDVVDTTVPVIILTGSDPQTIEAGSPYTEQGATALDNYDGDISASIIIDSSPVNTNALGSYLVTYNVTDSNGNAAVQVARTIDVVDTTEPVITLIGSDPQAVEIGSPYVEQGATALDNYDGDLSGSILISSTAVNTGALGSYLVTYDVTDSNGNAALQVTRTVDVVDTVSPGLAGMNPPDDSTNVSINAPLMLSFNEVVYPGSGELIISNLTDGTEHERINTINTMGGMNYALNNLLAFDYGKDYAVIVPVTCYTDIAGNPFSDVLSADVWNFTIEPPTDLVPPVISLSHPGPVTTNQSFTVSLSVDEDFAWYSTNGGTSWVQVSALLPANLVIPDTTTMLYYAEDGWGNNSGTNTVTWTFDTQPPLVTADIPSTTTNQAVNVSLSTTEDAAYWTTNGWTDTYSFNAGSTVISIDAADGDVVVLEYYGRDNLGNVGMTNSRTYSFDKIAPVVSITDGPASDITTNQAFDVTLGTTEDLGYWSTNGVPYKSFSLSDSILNIDSTTVLSWYGQDAYGNISPVNSVTYTLNNTGIPNRLEVLITSPAVAGESLSVTLRLLDAGGLPCTAVSTNYNVILAGLTASPGLSQPLISSNGSDFLPLTTAVHAVFIAGVASNIVLLPFNAEGALLTASSPLLTGTALNAAVDILPGPADGSTSVIYTAPAGRAAVDEAVSLYLALYDLYGNTVTNSTNSVRFDVNSAGSWDIAAYHTGSNVYRSAYTPKELGIDRIRAIVNGQVAGHDMDGRTDDGIYELTVQAISDTVIDEIIEEVGIPIFCTENPVRLDADRVIIFYNAPLSAAVTIDVFDVLARKIVTFDDLVQVNNGHNEFLEWDLMDKDKRRRIAKGLYFIRMTVLPQGGTEQIFFFKLEVE